MIFKPDRPLPFYQYYAFHIFVYVLISFITIPATFALEFNELKISRTELEVGFKQNQNKNGKLILPFYPFKHKLTYEADSLFIIEAIPEALRRYEVANRIFEDEENWEGVAYTNNMMFEIYTNKIHDNKLAEEICILNIEIIKEKLGDQHPLLSDTYLTYGSYLDNKGEADKALEYLNLSLDIKTRFFGDKSIQVAEVNYRLGQHYQYSQQDFDNAFRYYNRSFIVFDMTLPSDHIDLIKVYYSLASTYNYRMDYQRAKIYIDHALYLYSMDSIRNLRRIALSEILKGNILNETANYDFSSSYFKSADDKIIQLQGENSFWLIYTNNGIGLHNLRMGNYIEALRFFEDALRVCNLYSSEDDPIDLYSYILNYKGTYFSKVGSPDSASYYLHRALNVHKRHFPGEYLILSRYLKGIAEMHMDIGQYDSALQYTQKALITLISDFDNPDYKFNPVMNFNMNLPDLIQIVALKAEIIQSMYPEEPTRIDHLKEALSIYELLDILSDGVKNSELAEESKLILISDFHQIFNNALSCTYKLYQITDDIDYLRMALKFLEKNKYMLLLQNLELARKSNELNISTELRYKEDSLKQAYVEINRKIENNEVDKENELISHRLEIDKAITALRQEISSNYPSFYQIEYDSLNVTLEMLQEYTKRNDDLLIQYFMGDSTIYIIAIDSKRITFHKTQWTDKLDQHVSDFLKILSRGLRPGESSQKNFSRYTNSAYSIYRELVLPVFERHSVKKGQQVIVVPDGLLAQVPFDALIKMAPKAGYPDYTKLDYLLLKHNISYAYSFNLLLKENKLVKQNKILAFSYTGIDIQENPGYRTEGFIEISGTSKETAAIKKIVKGNNLFFEDENATETEFKEKSGDFQILHLAVHGVGDYESSINSRLVFKNQNDSLNDGNLYIYELYNLDLNQSKLTVLSACETGIGKEYKGEGIFSVARGFASAGCPSIIMSLWNINDEISSQIMTTFYGYLTKGDKINEALRNAKIKYIQNSDPTMAHPGNWAAFIPLGKMNAIYRNPNRKIMMGIIIFVIIIIPIMVYIYHRKRTRAY